MSELPKELVITTDDSNIWTVLQELHKLGVKWGNSRNPCNEKPKTAHRTNKSLGWLAWHPHRSIVYCRAFIDSQSTTIDPFRALILIKKLQHERHEPATQT